MDDVFDIIGDFLGALPPKVIVFLLVVAAIGVGIYFATKN